MIAFVFHVIYAKAWKPGFIFIKKEAALHELMDTLSKHKLIQPRFANKILFAPLFLNRLVKRLLLQIIMLQFGTHII